MILLKVYSNRVRFWFLVCVGLLCGEEICINFQLYFGGYSFMKDVCKDIRKDIMFASMFIERFLS